MISPPLVGCRCRAPTGISRCCVRWLIGGDDQGGCHLTTRSATLTDAGRSAQSLVGLADPIMRRVNAETGETVFNIRLSCHAAVCIHGIEPTPPTAYLVQARRTDAVRAWCSARVDADQ